MIMADPTDSLQRLRSVTESLQKLAECPVCLDSLKVPFKLCTRGHMMCCSCVESLTVCPSCEADFSIETPVGVKNLLEALPKVCQYSSEGCQDVVESGGDHETYCKYRPQACREWNCKSVVPVCKLLEHYRTKHPKCLILTKENHNLIWRDFNPSAKKNDDIPVDLFGNFFWVVLTNDIDEKQFKVKFEVVPSSKPVKNYYVCVEFKNDPFSYSYTLKACISKSANKAQQNSSDDTDCNVDGQEDDNEDNQYCMRVPAAELKQFINTSKELGYSYRFFTYNSM